MAEREIKYRGLKTFQIFSGEMKSVWIYGFYLKRGTYGDPGPQAHIFVYENGYEGYRVDAKTIGQFTEMTDSEGKEIYEDDIISFDNGQVGVVRFHRGCFVVCNEKGESVRLLHELDHWNIKILGNCFENPELQTAQSVGKKNDLGERRSVKKRESSVKRRKDVS